MYRKVLRRRAASSRKDIFRKEWGIGLTWWGIGLLFGLLFAITLGKDIRQSLGQYLHDGVEQAIQTQSDYFDYFLKRCLAYGKLFLAVWLLTYWTYGSWGIKLILSARGFLQGYAQGAWIFAYGMRGVFLGMAAHCPHNMLLVICITGIGCIIGWMRQIDRKTRILIQGGSTVLLAMLVAGVEAYAIPMLLKAIG